METTAYIKKKKARDREKEREQKHNKFYFFLFIFFFLNNNFFKKMRDLLKDKKRQTPNL